MHGYGPLSRGRYTWRFTLFDFNISPLLDHVHLCSLPRSLL